MVETQYDFPTEVLDLPSKGLVYPKEHPLSSGQITIKHMTAKEEDILASQNLIKKGIVLDKLFESIIVDDVNINDILVGDKNAIILATRLLGYGADYNVSFYSSKAGKTEKATTRRGRAKKKADEPAAVAAPVVAAAPAEEKKEAKKELLSDAKINIPVGGKILNVKYNLFKNGIYESSDYKFNFAFKASFIHCSNCLNGFFSILLSSSSANLYSVLIECNFILLQLLIFISKRRIRFF